MAEPLLKIRPYRVPTVPGSARRDPEVWNGTSGERGTAGRSLRALRAQAGAWARGQWQMTKR
jgi:hypothetical protein